MKSSIQSILAVGSEGLVIDIECHFSNGLPGIIIVGLGNKAIGEAKERIRSAFASSNIPLPRKRITINLAPADIPKDSTSLDMAIAAAILEANTPSLRFTREQAFIGEVSLTGIIRPVRGIIGKLLAGKSCGISTYFIPAQNFSQAALVPGIRLIPIQTIADLLHVQADAYDITRQPDHHVPATPPTSYEMSLAAIAGQAHAKRALEIAAAGAHNVLLYGPPGTGKSMLAKALPGIMPPPSYEEILEITHLHSLASQNYDELLTTRPFRSPHNSASFAAVLGGGDGRLPGEVALSHHGVLFLDELPEFNRTTLEALRQPLEDGCITISRARRTVRYPTQFILVATANPCPCGYYGTAKTCSCTPHQVHHYQQKVSGPIMDRIDLHVAVDSVAYKEILQNNQSAEQDDQVRRRVQQARHAQQLRYRNPTTTNARLSAAQLSSLTHLEETARELLDTAAERLDISARSYVKLVRVARTIADLEGSDYIQRAHISEALQYRQPLQRP